MLDIDPQPEWAATLHDPEPEEQDYAEGEAPEPKRPKPPAAQKPQALPPKKPKTPQPSGTPVKDALTIEAKGHLGLAIEGAVDSIDKVHGDGALPKIPVKQSSDSKMTGAFWRKKSGAAIRIDVSSESDTPRVTTAHEIGHFLDNNGIPRTDAGPRRDFRKEPMFAAWAKAIDESEAVKSIRDLRARHSITLIDPDGAPFQYQTDLKHVEYLLQDNELWARSYAQYITTRSEDPIMLAEIANKRASQYSQAYKTQWSDEDFKPIATAIDGLFKKLGWIK